MKRCIALVFAASLLCLAGCVTTPHAAKWEYKVEDARQWVTPSGGTNSDWQASYERRMNELGKDGWVLMHRDGNIMFFMRPLK